MQHKHFILKAYSVSNMYWCQHRHVWLHSTTFIISNYRWFLRVCVDVWLVVNKKNKNRLNWESLWIDDPEIVIMIIHLYNLQCNASIDILSNILVIFFFWNINILCYIYKIINYTLMEAKRATSCTTNPFVQINSDLSCHCVLCCVLFVTTCHRTCSKFWLQT
jgi:hypothetical protein